MKPFFSDKNFCTLCRPYFLLNQIYSYLIFSFLLSFTVLYVIICDLNFKIMLESNILGVVVLVIFMLFVCKLCFVCCKILEDWNNEERGELHELER